MFPKMAVTASTTSYSSYPSAIPLGHSPWKGAIYCPPHELSMFLSAEHDRSAALWLFSVGLRDLRFCLFVFGTLTFFYLITMKRSPRYREKEGTWGGASVLAIPTKQHTSICEWSHLRSDCNLMRNPRWHHEEQSQPKFPILKIVSF